MTGYARKFDENITMSFRVNNNNNNNNNNNKQLLKNLNKIWEKIQKLMRIDFESKPIYGNDYEKYIKTCAGSVITNFHNKKVPKEKSPCKCLSMIMLYSVIKANKKYYPQTFLEECKYAQENINHIDDNLK